MTCGARHRLRQWFPCDVEGEWSVGSELQFTFLHGEGEGLSDEELRGEVLTVDPPHLLEFRWSGSSVLNWSRRSTIPGLKPRRAHKPDVDGSTGGLSQLVCIHRSEPTLRILKMKLD